MTRADRRSEGPPSAGFRRTLPLPPGGFFEAWARDPGRFEDLLPNPFAEGAAQEAIRRLASGGPRVGAAAAILETNRAFGGDALAIRAAERLADPATVAIVTGQQPGLFGGPLYGLVKGLSAVAAAREFEAETGRPAVAIFWIEGDDHDFEEIRTAWVLDRAGTARPFRYAPENERAGLAACRRILDESVSGLIAGVRAALPETAFTRDLFAALSRDWAPGVSFVEAFGRFLLHLTRGTGLLVMDPTVPELKRQVLGVFRTALEREREGRRRIAARSRRIEAAGFRAQAAPEGYGVFRTGAGGVRARVRSGADGALGLEASEPSAAVLLRPIVQDSLLPTVAYVGGPAEIAYHAQIGDLYGLHEVPRPLVIPRHQLAVLNRSALRVLDEDGIGFDELRAGDEAALNRRAADPASVRALTAAKAGVRSRLDEVERTIGAIDGSLTRAAARARGKILAILGDLEAKSVRAAKRRDDERRQRFLRARNALFPNGTPQERRLCPLVHQNRYGPDFAGWLLDALTDPGADRRARNLVGR